jgi:hypothetical protein
MPEGDDGLGRIKDYIIPRFDELTLYLHGISLFMLVAMSADFRGFLASLPAHDGRSFVAEAVIFLGAFLSILNALLYRKKTDFEKTILLLFAILSNFVVSVYTLMQADKPGHEIDDFSRYVMVFNLLYMIALGMLVRLDIVTEASISDEDAPHYQVILLTVPIALTYVYCQFILRAPWNATYSWCVFIGLITKELIRFVADEVIFLRGKRTVSPQSDTVEEELRKWRESNESSEK